MKPSLQLKMGQSLTMTPQLQQAIRLLQLSTLELQQEIQEALESNPLLELIDDQNPEDSSEVSSSTDEAQSSADKLNESSAEPQASLDTNEPSPESSNTDSPIEFDNNNDIPDELPVDSQWEEIYDSPGPASSNHDSNNDNLLETRNAASETLFEHLIWQLNLTPFSNLDRTIAYAIIESLDPNGFLTVSLEDIQQTLENGTEDDVEVDIEEVVAVLHRIQQFDPPGVAATGLGDCLLIQLNQLANDTPWINKAKLLLSENLDLLENRDYNQIMRRLKLKEPDLKSVLQLVQSLNPCPGELISSQTTDYIVPDVIVSKKNNRWLVELNPDIAPKLRINKQYASMIKRADNSDDNVFLKNNLQEARWFIKSLHSRNDTLLKVASKIVEFQRGFFDYGEEAMKPLVLNDIAESIEMHESTISRVTTQKYMHTPTGIFELKYFFSSHVSTASGGECSSTAIRAIIKKLVGEENPGKPLSDSKIAKILQDKDINVARRTIAKYRESLSIPPSNARKKLI